MLLYCGLFPHLPRWTAAAVVFVPWLIVFTISFCHRPPFGPRLFRRCLIFAIVWYAGMTLITEALLRFFLDLAPSRHLPIGIARVLMYLFGTASVIVFTRAGVTLRDYETDSA